MFEIQAASLSGTRQRNAENKARTERPALIQKTADTFDVYSTTFSSNTYQVRFLRSDDKIFASCECEAGQNGQPCYHAMAAYQTVYSQQLATAGANLLNRQSVGNLGFVGTVKPNPAAKVLNLVAGQSFTAGKSVKLTIEPLN